MAGFNTAITGLKAASTMLDVTGNNIANSSTVGFKGSRTEFADIYASSVVGAGSSNIAGAGVTVSDIAQDFSAGTVEFTSNNLDLAINGQGFFQLNDGRGGITYTRAGAFELDKDGAIVSKTGSYLQGVGLDAAGRRTTLGNMAVTSTFNPPKPTEVMELAVNIDAALDPNELLTTFDVDEPSSYSYSTTVEVIDNLGNPLSTSFYFVEQKPSRDVYTYDVSGITPGTETGNTTVTISGKDYYFPDPSAYSGDPLALVAVDNTVSLAIEDPRIDEETIYWTPTATDGSTGSLSFEFFADSSAYGDMIDPELSDGSLSLNATADKTRPSNEVHQFDLNIDQFDTGFGNYDGTQTLSVTFAGVKIVIPASDSLALNAASSTQDRYNLMAYVAGVIAGDSAVLDSNPDIESVNAVVDSSTGEHYLEVVWKAEVGNVLDSSINMRIDSPTSLVGLIDADAMVTAQGDASYQGTYRLYGYLTDQQGDVSQLDLGKLLDPTEPPKPPELKDTEEGPILVKFDPSNGLLASINGTAVTNLSSAPKIQIEGWDPSDRSNVMTLDLTNSTQFSSTSIVKTVSQDGYPAGDLIGVSFGPSGEVIASYSNGQQQNLGVVQIATFANQSGLQSVGDTEWAASLLSGTAILNDPGSGLGGTLSQAALEQSNVDLSAELVNLIKAQRNFQANSKTLETMNTVTQAILQI